VRVIFAVGWHQPDQLLVIEESRSQDLEGRTAASFTSGIDRADLKRFEDLTTGFSAKEGGPGFAS
jgi:hypothetical protein